MAEGKPLLLQCRRCCRKSDPDYKNYTQVELGGCREIRQADDITQAAIDSEPLILFHPVNPGYPLIDFIYQDKEGTFHAFQVTTSAAHSAKTNDLQAVEKRLAGRRFRLYYLVPGEKFRSFVTDPAVPETTLAIVPSAPGTPVFGRIG